MIHCRTIECLEEVYSDAWSTSSRTDIIVACCAVLQSKFLLETVNSGSLGNSSECQQHHCNGSQESGGTIHFGSKR